MSELARHSRGHEDVVAVEESRFLCAESGQRLIQDVVRRRSLTRLVVVACSPLMHEITFSDACRGVGLNPYTMHMANVREHVAWVTPDRAEATDKAKAMVTAAVHRVKLQRPLEINQVPVIHRVLVLGAGIAGLEAALRLADAGVLVVLVEREPVLGGHMAMIDRTFPTLDCSACVLVPRTARVAEHPLITVFTASEVEDVTGHVGSFRVRIRSQPRSIDSRQCSGCGECVEDCPVSDIPSEFDRGLGTRHAIYFPFPQAVPNLPIIDRSRCLHFQSGGCSSCADACSAGAVDFEQQEEVHELEVGAVVVATGFELFDPSRAKEYGYGRWPDILTSLQFERMCHPLGPTGGRIQCADGRVPKRIAILHCIGSRDARFNRYCSAVCCMAALKFSLAARWQTGARVFDFYVDMRVSDKGGEQFYERAQREDVIFVQGKGTEVIRRHGKLLVKAQDSVLGRRVIVPVDMVVLAVGMEPRADASRVAQLFGIGCNPGGFFLEKHLKLAPVETVAPGVLLAGACQGPKDIPGSVAQAGSAAAAVLTLLAHGAVDLDPTVATVDESRCGGCGLCVVDCPEHAIALADRDGRTVSAVDEVLCRSCGSCAATCPTGAASQLGYTDAQLLAEVEGLSTVGPRRPAHPDG
ncbi:MAG: CoB--CoM heterodisulfide reductase iron-sulfur subunit A family protein [Deltaproteobacteria bacterium]|nr:CoB--CoM heterodisulfide reductase iron-sulfur subunit A family protein [Deltaproteobacteria bacterium]